MTLILCDYQGQTFFLDIMYSGTVTDSANAMGVAITMQALP